MRFIGGPKVRVEQDGKTFEGEFEITPKGETFLWMFTAVITVKKDALITVLDKAECKEVIPPYSEKEAQKQFEIWQKLKYNNFIEQSEDLSDEERQWHWY